MELPPKTRDVLKRYGLAAAGAVLSVLMRGALPVPEGTTVYQLPLTAIVLSGWFGGRGPGFVALAICSAVISYLFLPPSDSFAVAPEYLLGFCLFLVLGFLLVQFSASRFRVERALKESERRFRLMAETVPEMLWFESIEPRAMLYISPRYQEIWGRPAADLERDPAAWIEAVQPEDRDEVKSAYQRWLSGDGTERFDATFRIARPDGGTRWIHSKGTLIRDEEGSPYRASGIAEDITERKRAEGALAATQAELAHVSRLTTLGQLAASIAHEVNQPLAAVATYASACRRWLAREPPALEKLRETVANIEKEASRAAEVIARVRALTRRAPPQRDRVDVNDIVGDVIALTRAEAEKGRVALHARLSPGLPNVFADRVQLQQVLLNLILNGIESACATADGAREVVIGSATDGPNGVLLTVRDNGVGLIAANTDRLFEPFFTTKPSGMGMGLTISRSIIELHGGRIWATPNEPRGAVFQFTLPESTPSSPTAGRHDS